MSTVVEWCEADPAGGIRHCQEVLTTPDVEVALRARAERAVRGACERSSWHACLIVAELSTPVDVALARRACDQGFEPACWIAGRAEPGTDQRILDGQDACYSREHPNPDACTEIAVTLAGRDEITRGFAAAHRGCTLAGEESCREMHRLARIDRRLVSCAILDSVECQALTKEYREHGRLVEAPVDWPLAP
jgi:hypothetical protein